ncbi:MAG: LD-carboxypeptidase [Proteobacteria bacterium]|nr:LD-carboxypeptidase [Pseudomonadota bacterium]
MKIKTLRIIKASSPDREGILLGRIKELEDAGFDVLFEELSLDPSWPYCASSVQNRSRAFNEALMEDQSDAVWWARGGYGTSELLDFVPWPKVLAAKTKPIIGFSDACAAQSALYTITGRASIHGPMPATVTWKKSGSSDIHHLVACLKGESDHLSFEVEGPSRKIVGKVFGGSLSVLTSLIGTNYIPKSLAGHILMFEDIAENPGRIIRMLNQWYQSGKLSGVCALVFGTFTILGGELADNSPLIYEEIRKRFSLPIFTTTAFGHGSPNEPFVIGNLGEIAGGKFRCRTTGIN